MCWSKYGKREASASGIVQLKCDGRRLTHGRGSEGETDEWSG